MARAASAISTSVGTANATWCYARSIVGERSCSSIGREEPFHKTDPRLRDSRSPVYTYFAQRGSILNDRYGGQI